MAGSRFGTGCAGFRRRSEKPSEATLNTIQRAAKVLGMRVRLELI
jgi:hypothetical protein